MQDTKTVCIQMGGLSEKSSFTFYCVVTQAGEENSGVLLGGIINWWLHEGPDSHITYLQAFFPQCSPRQLWFSVDWKTNTFVEKQTCQNLSVCASVWPQVTPTASVLLGLLTFVEIAGVVNSEVFWGLVLANKPDQPPLLHPIEIQWLRRL